MYLNTQYYQPVISVPSLEPSLCQGHLSLSGWSNLSLQPGFSFFFMNIKAFFYLKISWFALVILSCLKMYLFFLKGLLLITIRSY